MKAIKKYLAPKEVQAACGLLEEASIKFKYSVFESVKCTVEEIVLENSKDFVEVIKKGMSVRQWVYAAIANIAQGRLESGELHLYHGFLNPLGPGKDLLKIFDAAVVELVSIGAVTPEEAKKLKESLDRNIAYVG